MNETEKRRKRLLKEMKQLYSTDINPAVHPRYSDPYHYLYKERPNSTGSLGLRVILSVLLFLVFIVSGEQNKTIGMVSSQEIVNAISSEHNFTLDLSEFYKGL